MKPLLLFITLSVATFSFAQSSQDELEKAATFIQAKDYCSAYNIFEKNLNSETNSAFDYYYATVSAAKCDKTDQAFIWLSEAKNKGLGLRTGELDYLLKDENLKSLHTNDKWKLFISSIHSALEEKAIAEKAKSKEWVQLITSNAITSGKKFSQPNSGYALYYSEAGSQKVPYLVYVPSSYSAKSSTKAIVFLHGGIVSTADYNDQNPEIKGEPIFQYGETHNTIIIYPFGKKDFGWVNQLDAFKNIVTITKDVQNKYNIDKNKIYLGGMSNGGTATFWFASQKNLPYKGYFAISALPKLNIGEIDFKNISEPLYSINAKDDKVYNYDEVNKIYLEHQNKNWHFETAETGNHGLIYNENGQEILSNLLEKLNK